MYSLSGRTDQAACAICGGGLATVLLTHSIPDRFERHLGIGGADYRRDWVKCDSCGSCTNVMDSENAERLAGLSDTYYDVDFHASTVAEKYAKVMALPPEFSDNAARVARVSERLNKWRSAVTPDAEEVSILDVGAGTGVFLAKLLQSWGDRQQLLRAVALEPDSIAAAHLRSLGKIEVVESAFDLTKVGRGYGLVTMNKVIEHVSTPCQMLAEVIQALDPDAGLIYIEVPDVATIGRRPRSDNILGSLHHHLYSPPGLIALFVSSGLQVLDVGRLVEPSGKITVFGFASPTKAFDRYLGVEVESC